MCRPSDPVEVTVIQWSAVRLPLRQGRQRILKKELPASHWNLLAGQGHRRFGFVSCFGGGSGIHPTRSAPSPRVGGIGESPLSWGVRRRSATACRSVSRWGHGPCSVAPFLRIEQLGGQWLAEEDLHSTMVGPEDAHTGVQQALGSAPEVAWGWEGEGSGAAAPRCASSLVAR